MIQGIIYAFLQVLITSLMWRGMESLNAVTQIGGDPIFESSLGTEPLDYPTDCYVN